MWAIFQRQLNHPIHAQSRRHLLISPRRRRHLQFNCSRPQRSRRRRKSHHSQPIWKKTGTRIHRHHKRLLQIVLYLNHPFLWSNCFNTDGIWGQLHETARPTNTKRARKMVTAFTKSCWTQCNYCPSPTFLKSQTIHQTSLKKGKLTPTMPVLATVKKRIVGGWQQVWRGKEARRTHQWVIKTHWWLELQVGGCGGDEKPPTSCNDSLVVEVAGWWVERRWEATNKS